MEEVEKQKEYMLKQKLIRNDITYDLTAEEIEIDATTQSAELLDEYAIKMDAATAKKQEKRNIIFIVVVFAILFLFVLFLRPLIKMIGI